MSDPAFGYPAALVVSGPDDDNDAITALCRDLLADGAAVHRLVTVEPGWLPFDPWGALDARRARADASVLDASTRLRDLGLPSTGEARMALEPNEIRTLIDAHPDALIIIGQMDSAAPLGRWLEVTLDAQRVVAFPGARPPGRIDLVLVPYAMGPEAAVPAVGELRRRFGSGPGLTLLRLGGDKVPVDAAEAAHVLGWTGTVRLAEAPEGHWLPAGRLSAHLAEAPADLVALPAHGLGGAASRLLAWIVGPGGASLPCAALLIPGGGPPSAGRLDTADTPWLGANTTVWIEHVDSVGRHLPAHGEDIGFISGGVEVFETTAHAGRSRVPGVGLFGVSLLHPGHLLAAARILPTEGLPVCLFDAATPDLLARTRPHADRLRFWGVRLDASHHLRDLREALDDLPGSALLDANHLLDDGPADDVPREAAPIRLSRLARRLRLAGVPICLVLDAPDAPGIATIASARLPELSGAALEAHIADAPDAPADAIHALTDALPDTATTVSFTLDNRVARNDLLGAIDGALHRVHLQIYMFEDDVAGQQVCAALCAAANRGVTVRVLIDSLMSAHRSLGQLNPTLVRLDSWPGVQLVEHRPIPGVPSKEDLKQRDHRKLLIVDGAAAWVSGRNIGTPYLTGFDEVSLTAESSYRDVPWLDAWTRCTGPVVAHIETTFAQAWTAAGGPTPPPAVACPQGQIPARLVQHQGLRDAHTLELYRWLMDSAHSQITVVNTFPLQFELQRALLRAVARGVSVRFLVGNVRPMHGARVPFAGAGVRELADAIIHGRVDALVEAGARAWEYALPKAAPVDGVDDPLWPIRPHVHAKLLSVDGRACTIGSANLDVTAAYWESEAVLLVEYAPYVAQLDAALDALLAHSTAIDPADPGWRDRADRRAWISKHWPAWLG